MLLGGPLPAGRLAGASLSPALAVVLVADVAPGTPSEAIHLAVGGTFLALEVRGGDGGGGVVMSERVLPPPCDGPLRLYLGGRLAVDPSTQARGGPPEHLSSLARQDGRRGAAQ